MTGRDIILYILNNELENEEVFNEEGIFVGFMSETEAASLYDVGPATIRSWYEMGYLRGIEVRNDLYFLKDEIDPRTLMKLSEFII